MLLLPKEAKMKKKVANEIVRLFGFEEHTTSFLYSLTTLQSLLPFTS